MNLTSRKILPLCALATVFALGAAAGQNKFGQPKSILHIITVQWKADSTTEQRQAAIDQALRDPNKLGALYLAALSQSQQQTQQPQFQQQQPQFDPNVLLHTVNQQLETRLQEFQTQSAAHAIEQEQTPLPATAVMP